MKVKNEFEALEQAIAVGGIAGVSALTAIAAVDASLPSWTNLYTALLAGLLAGLVRYCTVAKIPKV